MYMRLDYCKICGKDKQSIICNISMWNWEIQIFNPNMEEHGINKYNKYKKFNVSTMKHVF
jgi:hypothetical protein